MSGFLDPCTRGIIRLTATIRATSVQWPSWSGCSSRVWACSGHIPSAFLELGIIWNGAILDVLLSLGNHNKGCPTAVAKAQPRIWPTMFLGLIPVHIYATQKNTERQKEADSSPLTRRDCGLLCKIPVLPIFQELHQPLLHKAKLTLS